jgi:hypothetical protein
MRLASMACLLFGMYFVKLWFEASTCDSLRNAAAHSAGAAYANSVDHKASYSFPYLN